MAPSEEKKIALRKKKDILPQGEKFPCARREISVRTKKYFRAYNAENEMQRVFRNEMRQDGKTNCSGISLNIERAVKHSVASPLYFYKCADGYLSCAIGSAIAVIVMLVNWLSKKELGRLSSRPSLGVSDQVTLLIGPD